MNKGAAFWQGHVAAIRREGISANAYAKRHGIAVKRLYYWQRKAAVAVAGATQVSPFVALRIESLARVPAPTNCTVVLASGVRMEIATLPSPEWLAALDRATQGAH